MIDVLNPGICATCMHMTIIRSDRGAMFYRCQLSYHDPQFPKYPRLPVRICKGWSEKGEHTAELDEIEE